MTWIALFFSTMLAAPTTNYDLHQTMMNMGVQGNAYDILPDTQTISDYAMDFFLQEDTTAEKHLYSAVEQVISMTGPTIVLISTKFLAKPFWLITAKDWEQPELCTTDQPFSSDENFVVSSDSMAVAVYAMAKVKQFPEISFKLYKGQEYTLKENLDFKFKFK